MKRYNVNLYVSAMLFITALGIYFIKHNELLAIIIAGCACVELVFALVHHNSNGEDMH